MKSSIAALAFVLGLATLAQSRLLLQQVTNPDMPQGFTTFWMTDLWSYISNKPVSSIWMPGTHDSGTWDLQADTIDSSYANDCPVDPNNLPLPLDAVVGSTIAAYERGWSVAQVVDLPGQVAAGSRYLDLRVAYSPAQGGYYFTHCLTSVNSVPQQLQSLSAYLASTYAPSVTRPNGHTPKEVIFLNFYQFYGTWDLARHTDFMSQVLAAFQPGQIATGVTAASTLESVAQGGPKVVFIYNDEGIDISTMGPQVAASFAGQSTFGFDRQWADKDTAADLINFDNGQYASYMANPAPTFKVMEGVMTEGTSDIEGDPLGTLMSWEGNLGQTMTLWAYSDLNTAYGPSRKPFVLMLDFLNPIQAAVIASMNINAAPGSMPIAGYYGSCSASSSGFLGLSCNNINWNNCAPGYTRVYTGNTGGNCGCKCCNPDASDCGCDLTPGSYCL
ncbi:hypothetical protein N2152v2_004086 [Parachlorella kessleri]